MKKIFSILIIVIFVLAGCQNDIEESTEIDIKTTSFPYYSLIEQVGQEYVNVESIYPENVDPHHFELSSKEMLELLESDVFIYGAKSNSQLESEIEQIVQDNDSDLILVDISEDDLFKSSVDQSLYGESKLEDSETIVNSIIDPHFYISPEKGILVTKVIVNQLSQIDPDHKSQYQKNGNSVITELEEIDQKYQDFASEQNKTVYVAHDAYSYLNKDYNIEIEGVFGLDHLDEPSSKEIESIIDDINDQDIKYIYNEQNDLDNKVIKQIEAETDTQILTLHNMSTIDKQSIDENITYQDLLENNLDVIKKINE